MASFLLSESRDVFRHEEDEVADGEPAEMDEDESGHPRHSVGENSIDEEPQDISQLRLQAGLAAVLADQLDNLQARLSAVKADVTNLYLQSRLYVCV